MAKILIAASPEPCEILERVLAGHDLVCPDTIARAEQFLHTHEFDLIVCTVLFDDSRMFDLLRMANPSMSGSRFHSSVCASEATF
jgi:hypothetical protein